MYCMLGDKNSTVRVFLFIFNVLACVMVCVGVWLCMHVGGHFQKTTGGTCSLHHDVGQRVQSLVSLLDIKHFYLPAEPSGWSLTLFVLSNK